MPLLAPLVNWTKATRVAVGVWCYAAPGGLGCTNVTAHPDAKVVIHPGTTIACIRLTRTLFADDKQPSTLIHWLHGVPEGHPHVPILQVRLHADDMHDVVRACTGRANPTANKTQRRHVGMQVTTLLFAAHNPTTKKAGKELYPFKHPHISSLRKVVDSKPTMSLQNYSLTTHSPYRGKPELVGLTTPVLMECKDSVLAIPMCHTLLLIGTSEPVKQVDVFHEVSEDLSQLDHKGHMFKEEFLANDGEMLANMKIEADTVGHMPPWATSGAASSTWHGQAQTGHPIHATRLWCKR